MKKYGVDMLCSMCGEIQVIQRLEGYQKKAGHIKDLWCPNCMHDRKFIEIKDRDIYYYKLLHKEQRSEVEEYFFGLLESRKERKKYEKKRNFKY